MIHNDRLGDVLKTPASIKQDKKGCSAATSIALAAIALTVTIQAALFYNSQYLSFSNTLASYQVSYATLFANGTLLVTLLPVTLCAHACLPKTRSREVPASPAHNNSLISKKGVKAVETSTFVEPSREVVESELLKRVPEGLYSGEYVHFDFEYQGEKVLVFAKDGTEFQLFFGKGKDRAALLEECAKWHHGNFFNAFLKPLEEQCDIGELIYSLRKNPFSVALDPETGNA